MYLKFDCATRQRTNYLGLNVRFLCKKEKAIVPVTKTLAVVDTLSHHSAHDLRQIILKKLEEFKISLDQVLVCVTDNASNMVKLVHDLNIVPESGESSSGEEETDCESELEEYVHEENLELLDYENIIPTKATIEHMRCAVHTLQLAIQEGIHAPQISSLIGKLRRVAKEARTPKINEKLKWKAHKVAILDQDTRWGSTYCMIKRLIELKSYIQDMADVGNRELDLPTTLWDQAQELENLLRKSYEVTLKLQYEDLTPGWITLV